LFSIRLKDDNENLLDEMDYLKSIDHNDGRLRARNAVPANGSESSNSNSSDNLSVRTVERLEDRRLGNAWLLLVSCVRVASTSYSTYSRA
jgi:hypothetical protein